MAWEIHRLLLSLAQIRRKRSLSRQSLGAMSVQGTRGLNVIKAIKGAISLSRHIASDVDMRMAMSALINDPFIAHRFMHFPDVVLEEMGKHVDGDKIFLPCSPLELSTWCNDDKIYLPYPRICHSLRFLEKNEVNNFFGIQMSKPSSIVKLGSILILHGKCNNFCGSVESIVCSPNVEHIAAKIRKEYGQHWQINTFISFSKTSATYNINIPKLGIDEKIKAEDPRSALDEVLAKAWKNTEESKFFRRVPEDYLSGTWLADPAVSSGVVKLASSWPPVLGSRVRVRPSNGMPGGKIGTVVSVDNGYFVVDFDGSKIKYDVNNPRTITQIDADLT